jgi:serine/threonine protein phosphatase 1
MFGRRKKERGPPHTPRGYRAYAIGDVHGRLDLLNQLLAAIEEDVSRRPPRKSLLIFLGDLIDRGPDSMGVVERLRTYRHDRLKPHFLVGNHEEVLLRLLAGERGILASWLKFGGSECLQSYGVDPVKVARASERSGLAMVKQAIPASHASFIGDFADTIRLGDYLFVHAGVRPGVDLSLQSQSDLRWIRSPFLEDDADHGFVVVHGHSIAHQVEYRPNRIGIDTGAYKSGVLTAVALDGEDRWTLDTSAATPTTAGAAH